MKKVRCITDKFCELDFDSTYYAKENISYLENSFYDIYTLNEKIIGTFSSENFIDENSEEISTPKYYDNTNGTLYKVAKERGWNAYLFEIVKRVERAEKKGEFISDIKKSISVLELYLKEQGHNFENEIEPLNK